MFEYLKDLDIRESTSWCYLPEITPGAALELRPATAENRFYTNAALRLAGERPRGKSRTAGDSATIVDIDEARADARLLYPKWIVKNWKGLLDKPKGEEVPFTTENCVDFFRQATVGLLDQIMTHAINRANFLPSGEVIPDTGELAGNLRSGSSGS